jgi:hypothetical protein
MQTQTSSSRKSVEIEEDSDREEEIVESSSSSEDDDRIEDYPEIKALNYNWKILSVVCAFMNRSLLEQSDLKRNISVKDKKLIPYIHNGEPTILNVVNLDFYGMNLFRQFHNSLDFDCQYLANKPEAIDFRKAHAKYYSRLSNFTTDTLTKLEAGLMTINEHTVNFITDSSENLYEPRVRKVVEYFLRQREYYLSIGKIKAKYDGGEGHPPTGPIPPPGIPLIFSQLRDEIINQPLEH